LSSEKNGHSNGHSNGQQQAAAVDLQRKRSAFLQQQLANAERPARMVGLFTSKAMKPHEVERLVDVCLRAMREEDQGASLTLSPLGNPSPAELELQRTWKLSVVEYTDATPHDCLIQLFAMDDPQSSHHALLGHLSAMDEEMGRATRESVQDALTYLTVSSGRLDDKNRIHPYENVVALFTSALNALIVDPAAAMVTMDPGEWADAMEMSLELESGMKLLRR
jgi:hypothetical protein